MSYPLFMHYLVHVNALDRTDFSQTYPALQRREPWHLCIWTKTTIPVHSLLQTDLLNALPSGETKEILCLCMWWQDLYFTQESIDKWWIPDLKWYLLKHGFKTETTLCKPKNEEGNQLKAQITWISDHHHQGPWLLRLPTTLYLSALNSDSLYIAIILFDKRNTFTDNIPWAVFSGSKSKKVSVPKLWQIIL